MKKTICRFTLVEMLTVVAIIGILAGLIVPVVALSQQRGRVTQAKSDITSLMTALKGLESDYNKFLKKNGSNYEIGSENATTTKIKESDAVDAKDKYVRAKLTDASYDAMIAELSAPKNRGFTDNHPVSVNKRKRVYLEPKSGFNPSASYTGQTETLWRDPWGNAYVIYLNADKSGELKVTNSKVIASDIAIYSKGPDGTDNEGCNVDLDSCISSGTHKSHDDIASWAL